MSQLLAPSRDAFASRSGVPIDGKSSEVVDRLRDSDVEVAHLADRRHRHQGDAESRTTARTATSTVAGRVATRPCRAALQRFDERIEREREQRADRERRSACAGSNARTRPSTASMANAIASGMAERGSMSIGATRRTGRRGRDRDGRGSGSLVGHVGYRTSRWSTATRTMPHTRPEVGVRKCAFRSGPRSRSSSASPSRCSCSRSRTTRSGSSRGRSPRWRSPRSCIRRSRGFAALHVARPRGAGRRAARARVARFRRLPDRARRERADAAGSSRPRPSARPSSRANSDSAGRSSFTKRVERLVDAIPQRLAGGSRPRRSSRPRTAGVAFLAGLILTLFFVLYGPALVDGGLGQIDDDPSARRARSDRACARGRGAGSSTRA